MIKVFKFLAAVVAASSEIETFDKMQELLEEEEEVIDLPYQLTKD